jgi:hypothetical protein
MPIRFVGIILLALVAAVGAGWMAGAAGRTVLERDLQRSAMRVEFADARALALDGRVSLFQSNFGDAIERFQLARTRIRRVQAQLREIGQAEQAGRLEIALSHLSDAQRAASMFDAVRAQAAADQAMQALLAAGAGS